MTKDLAEKSEDRFAQFGSPETEGQSYESRREIRLCGPQSSAGDIEEGHYYIVDYNKGDSAEYTDIGEEIDVQILRDCMRLRKWDSDEDRNTYDSSEFRSFKDVVVLYSNENIPTIIDTALPYTHDNKEAPSIKDRKEALGLRVRYFAYVLYEDEVFRMSFGATDNAGADAEEKPLGFNAPAEDSFMGLKKASNALLRDRLFMFTVKLGSRPLVTGKAKEGKEIFSKKIRPKTFTLGKQLETQAEQDAVYGKLVDLYKELAEQMWNKYSRIREEMNEAGLKADEWSEKVLENIDNSGPEPLVMSTGNNNALDEPAVKDAEVVDVAKQAEETFPPSEEVIAKQKQKIKDLSDSIE